MREWKETRKRKSRKKLWIRKRFRENRKIYIYNIVKERLRNKRRMK